MRNMLAHLFVLALCTSGAVVYGLDCVKLVPGILRMSLGVDLTSLDLKHDYTKNDVDGFVHKILDYHCDGKKKILLNDVEYDVPDEIETVVGLPTGMVIADTIIMNNTDDVKTVMSRDVGIDISLGKFGFGDSLSYKNTHEAITEKDKFIATNEAYVSVHRTEFIPAGVLAKSLDTYFLDYVNKLPATFEANPAAYYDFFKTYGTHYFERANFGGQLGIRYELDTKIRTVMNDKAVGNNAQANFLTFLKLHGGYNKDVSTVDKEFTSMASNQEMYFGGTANLFLTEGYQAWWPTVATNPWLYSGNLMPIATLVAGPKQAEIGKAFTAYFYHSFLGGVSQQVSTYISKNYAGANVAQEYLKQIQAQNALVTPDLATITKLDQEVQDYMVTPGWFKSGTQMCTHWQGEHCAIVQGATPAAKLCVYEFNCYNPPATAITLAPTGAIPSWFNQLQVQMVHTRNENPDHWLKFYYKLQLVAPETLPGWARNMKLCATVSEPCDVAQAKTVCVAPNVLTEELGFSTYYKKELVVIKEKKECGALSLSIVTI